MEEIVYNWNFHPLEVVYNKDTLSNVVSTVHWQLQATHQSTGITRQNVGTIGLEPPGSEVFVPFEELTKEIVTEWVEIKLGEEFINDMKAGLGDYIREQLNPTKGAVAPPW